MFQAIILILLAGVLGREIFRTHKHLWVDVAIAAALMAVGVWIIVLIAQG